MVLQALKKVIFLNAFDVAVKLWYKLDKKKRKITYNSGKREIC